MRIVGIVACDEASGIGKNGSIPWPFMPDDMKHFTNVTKTGQSPAVLMGYRTHLSIGKKLPKRYNIVVARDTEVPLKCDVVVSSVTAALKCCYENNITDLFIIGGKHLYEVFTNYVYDDFYVTHIPGTYDCDVSVNFELFAQYTCDKLSIGNLKLSHFKPHVGIINPDEHEYKRLLTRALSATVVKNRTSIDTHVLCNQTLRFDLSNDTLPICTIRGSSIKKIFYELMWFIKGRTDLEYLHKYDIHIWDANAQTRPDLDGVGAIYGHQWRNFGGDRMVPHSGFDQIAYVVDLLKNDPTSRRIILSGWCPPSIFADACLPPCHVLYNFNVINDQLYCTVHQRSSDMGLALYWNVTSASLLMHMLAKVAGLKAAELLFVIANAHIYINQVDGVKKMIDNDSYRYPKIIIKGVKPIDEYEWEDIELIGKKCHPYFNIGEMAV